MNFKIGFEFHHCNRDSRVSYFDVNEISKYFGIYKRFQSNTFASQYAFRKSLALKIFYSPEEVLRAFAVLRTCPNTLRVRFVFHIRSTRERASSLNWIFMRMKRKVSNAFSSHSVSIFSFRYLVTFQITTKIVCNSL